MTDTTWTCDRCNEINDISDVRIVEHCADIGEVVCKPCLADECREEMNRSNAYFLSCFTDEI